MRNTSVRRAALRRMVEVCEPRRLLAAISWDGGGDGTNWSDANNWSGNVLPNSNDDVTIDVAANPTILLNSTTFVRSLVNRELLRISATGSSVTLQLGQNVLNEGRIELTSTGNTTINLSANGTVTNASAGTITALLGAGGTRSLNATTIVNAGTLSAASNTGFSLSATTNTITGGSLAAGAGSSFVRFSSGTYTQSGGAVTGRVQVISTTLSLSGAATGTLFAVGGNTLAEHSAAGLTLNNQYDPSFGSSLTVSQDLVLSGPIVLDSIGSSTSQFSIAANRTLTIAPTGSITAIGSGVGTSQARRISGSTNSALIVNGTISATGGAQLDVDTLNVDQNGTLSTSGVGSRLRLSSGRFNYLGGTNSGDVVLAGSVAISLVDAAGNVSLRSSAGNTLLQHSAPEITLDVVYDPSLGGTLDISSDVVVAGPITLTTLSTTTPTFNITAGFTLTIAPAGSITALGSGAGTTQSRNITGSTNSALINNGTIASQGGAELTISGLNFTQNGTLSTTGQGSRVAFDSNRFNYAGGTHSGDVFLRSSNLIRLTGSASPVSLTLSGGSTLVAHDTPDITLALVYDPNFGGSLTIDSDMSINGPLTFTTLTTSTPAITVVAGYTVTVGPAGSITAIGSGVGTTQNRTLNGSTNSKLINQGTIRSTGGAILNFSGLDLTNEGVFKADADSQIQFSGTFFQKGTIDASAANARIQQTSGRLEYLDGTHSGTYDVSSVELLLVDAAQPLTLDVSGSPTLVGHSSSDLTLNLVQIPALGGNLVINSDQVLSGAIRMTTLSASPPTISIGSGYTLTIAPSGSITAAASDAGTTDDRLLNGSSNSRLINNGLIDSVGGSSLNIGGSLQVDNNATLRAEANSSIQFSATRLDQSGTMDATAAGSEISIGGTLNYLTGSHAGSVFASSASLNLVTATSPVTLIARGSNTLLNHEAANITLYGRYEPSFGSTISINTNQTLAGPITLGSLGQSSPSLSLNASILTIAPGGSITAIASEGGTIVDRTFSGSNNSQVINNGLISATGGANLIFSSTRVDNNASIVSGADSTVNLASSTLNQYGVLDASASGAAIRTSSGRFNFLDGTATGEVSAVSSFIRLVGADAPTTILAQGSSTLVEHSAGNITLNVLYSPAFGAQLNVDSDLVLSGPITMSSVSTSQPSMSVSAGYTLTIAATGSITALGSDPGQTTNIRTLSGSTNSRLINFGTLAATGGAAFTVSSLNTTQRGTITASPDSDVTFSGTAFNYLNGSHSGNVNVSGLRLNVVNTSAPATLNVSSVTLVAHNEPDLTLLAIGGAITIESTLTVLGPIVVSSTINQGSGSVSLSAGSTLTIGNTGSLRFAVGTNPATSRTVGGSTNTRLINNGLVEVESGLTLSISLSSTQPVVNNGTWRVIAASGETTTLLISSGSAPIFRNAAGATFAKTGPGEANIGFAGFENKGTVNVIEGTLRFPNDTNIDDPAGSFLSGGAYRVSSGATLGFSPSPSVWPTVNTADVEVAGNGVVEFGRLAINRGRIALTGGADLSIDPDAALRFVNEGILDLSPNSVLTIVGGLDFAGTSQPVIRTELASATSFGRVDVTGSINLNSPASANRFDPDLVGGYDPALGSRHDVIVATAGIINGFDSFQGGLTPSNRVLRATRPNVNTVAVEVGPGPLPPAPQVLSQFFEFQTREALVFTFNQDVSAFLGRKDYLIVNTTTGQTVPQSAGTLTYNTTSNQAVLTLTGELPDGRYTLTVNASDIANSSGVPASGSPIVLNFHVLRGDLNRDFIVNFDDLLTLAQNYGQTGRNYSQGNLNYDANGEVGFDDLLILAQQYGASVLALPGRTGAARKPSATEGIVE